MKNPLIKRIPKEFKAEIGKYIVIFLFMTGTIGLISGFLVADNSMTAAYNDSFEKYNIEDGNFLSDKEIDNAVTQEIEKEGKITLYSNYYIEENTGECEGHDVDSTLRIFKIRDKVNKSCIMEGTMPENDKEIAIDRMYADNNKIKAGDYIEVGNEKLKVSGLIALSDYSALFSDNSDMMFDAVRFGVALVTPKGFDLFNKNKVQYDYSWKYDEAPEDDEDAKTKAEDLMNIINEKIILKNYIPAFSNQAIHFAGDDIGGDKAMMLTLLYILIAIMAFVFAITTSNTISNESCVIGTLRASGYTKGEIVRHYLTMPLVVSIISSIAGNILGYTFFVNMMAGLYYQSYSLPTYETIWNSEAFVLTTVIPFFIMLFINLIILINKLSLSPLKFLRRDLKKKQNKKAVKLPDFSFLNRFRLRVIFQNMPGYIMLFIGIIFANILLLFGMMMSPLLDHYNNEIMDNMTSKHEYILKMPAETDTSNAEKFCLTSLKTTFDNKKAEDISVYGIEDGSKYIDVNLTDDGVYISKGFSEKYSLKKGDTVTLKDKYGSKKYDFKISGIINYPQSLSIFMMRDEYNNVFEMDKNYFSGYFSDEEITDIDENYIASDITEDDFTKLSRQLKVSMGNNFKIVNVFAVVLYMILIYLLSKLIIEKNANSISMLKILGFENYEVSKLYLLTNTIVVIISTLISLPVAAGIIKLIYNVMMSEFNGWLTFYINPITYGKMFVMGMAVYLIVVFIENRKIKKIPMADALKNVE